jgi:SAM-dependent methyltransferase
MVVTPAEVRERTLAHYRQSFATHGASPRGVDWNGPESQRLQFEQLLKLLPAHGTFSLNDFGCGYGALVDMLDGPWHDVEYRGYDINADMIAPARLRYADRPGVHFEVADQPTEAADFSVASGVFTLRLGRSDDQCLHDMGQTLDMLSATSREGFAFNCLTSYSDVDKMKDYLYYPDPCTVFDICKRRYARNVALLHDYGLYAFTILVRKDASS